MTYLIAKASSWVRAVPCSNLLLTLKKKLHYLTINMSKEAHKLNFLIPIFLQPDGINL